MNIQRIYKPRGVYKRKKTNGVYFGRDPTIKVDKSEMKGPKHHLILLFYQHC